MIRRERGGSIARWRSGLPHKELPNQTRKCRRRRWRGEGAGPNKRKSSRAHTLALLTAASLVVPYFHSPTN
ncbi:hypothetical protein SESBI_09953 [Sesbania bispinosa]|nr:hypothetical protein SESBI_09953 [Sesbania bispinosa]